VHLEGEAAIGYLCRGPAVAWSRPGVPTAPGRLWACTFVPAHLDPTLSGPFTGDSAAPLLISTAHPLGDS
jgi:hypothetical protein